MSPDRTTLRRIAYRLRGGDHLSGCEDEDASRGFHLLLVSCLGWVCIEEFLLIPLFAVRKVAVTILVLIVGGTGLGALGLLRRRRKRPAAMLFLSLLWCVLMVFFTFSGGIHGPGSVTALVVILEAAWLLGRPATLSFAGATLVFTFIGALLDYSGHALPVYFPGAPMALWALEVLIVVQAVSPILSLLESRKKQVLALRDSEERFRSLSDASFEGIMIHDQGAILDANLAFARLFGYAGPDEMIGVNALETLMTPESRERVRERLARQATGVIELTCVRKDGATFFVETESRSMKHLGRDARLIACRDITGRRRAEEEKAQLQAELHQANKMESIGRLAGGIAHDFNNLLTVIQGYSGILAEQPDNPARQKYAVQIQKAGDLAANLTRQLLAFSRREVTRPVRLHVNAIVTESREMLERLVGVHIEMQTSLQALADETLADPNQMQQCLMNLVVNSRDAMPSGGRLIIETHNVEVMADEIPAGGSGTPGLHIRLTVRDSGIGMDNDIAHRVFEPFFTTKGKGTGTGLGLSAVYGIVAQWHGFLKVRSEPGEGSEFSMYLPLTAVAGLRPDPLPAMNSEAPPVSTATLLVVDDQDIVRAFVAESLRRRGYLVLQASGGEEALQIIERSGAAIDLLLTDILMPGMRGPELARRATAIRPAMKVLFMTGFASDLTGGNHPREGDAPKSTDEVIMKPCSARTLEGRVRELLFPAGVTRSAVRR